MLGVLPPIPVSTPWWQDIGPVVAAAKQYFDIKVTVLRLFSSERTKEAHGGKVTYLAETTSAIAVSPSPHLLDDHPLRLPYARPGGPARDLEWAIRELKANDISLCGQPSQIRTWNLSSIWKLPTEKGDVWLKHVPAFFAHEGTVLQALSGERVPEIIAHEGGRMLLCDIPGEDLYEASLEQRLAMISLLLDLQAKWNGRIEELATMGLPDWRAAALTAQIEDVFERTAPELEADERKALASFLKALTQRFQALTQCGIGDTLVHGDFHAGNVRGNDSSLALIDWGDSGIGHPLLDQPAFLNALPDQVKLPLKTHWNAVIRAAWPGSDPEHAAALLAPIAAARQAVIYRKFLDNIEPSEHVYHRGDPARWLKKTVEVLLNGQAN